MVGRKNMTENCEYKEICEAYKRYSSHPELSLYVWLTDNCDKLNIGICVNRENYQSEENNHLDKIVFNN